MFSLLVVQETRSYDLLLATSPSFQEQKVHLDILCRVKPGRHCRGEADCAQLICVV